MTLQRRFFLMGMAGSWIGRLQAAETQAQARSTASRLVFGLISPRAVAQTRANWAPFVDRLSTACEHSVDTQVYESQGDLVSAFKAGEIDMAWMGNAPALEVVEAGAGEVFAQMVTEDGSLGYKSLLIVQSTTALKTLKDVIDHAPALRFGDGDPKSTSGFLVPLYFAFQKNGVTSTQALFKSVEVGSHQQNLSKVAKGVVDVATANNEELAFFQRDFPDLAKHIRVVWESPLIPQSPLLWKVGLPYVLKQKIRKFVTGFAARDPLEKQILLTVNGLSRFRPSTNRQLVPIADLEMFKTRQAINNDQTLSKDQRLARISEAIERGSRLELKLKLSPQSP